ncbi:hypothetical protein E7811_12085 [Aliigemmobacter aestuarii]|uniref:3-hydroxyacyl-CoA dehydrogenase C-terminal domain-containing protein n=1 Tax=Aliigemmobacter aestuarii TaxID=1445661 RepID=A0A4S3MLC4_9RHOB|nr:enoyl-CoA hydratase-related protein [Gemmobacter aestuarii]THD82887.1 hypothetical protein E7811_12085 [Gemmobacter aestuarii]
MSVTERQAVRLDRTETGVLHVVIDNPPVNALSHRVRAGIGHALDVAHADHLVRAIVLRAEGRSFPAGADIAEFGLPPQPPLLPDLCARIESCPKPVVAAIHGSALGGGLELALAAHRRIADAQSRLGLPEVSLGLLPGAGGTQRTPRLIGAEQALRLMLSGRPVGAAEALAMGLVDRVVEDGLAAAAEAEALALAEAGTPIPTRDRREGMRDATAYQRAVAAARAALPKEGRLQAPARIIDCVEAALLLPFGQGLAFERAAFEDLLATSEAAALRHVFFAERALSRFPESGATPRPLRTIAVAGAAGVEQVLPLLQAGYSVILIEPAKSQLVAALELVAARQQELVTADKLTEAQRDADWVRLKPAMEFGVAARVEMVLLAAPEHLEKAAEATAPGTVLAHLGKGGGLDGPRGADVLGLTLGTLGPRLAEVIVAPGCAPETVATAVALVRHLGRSALRVAAPGGVVPRVLAAGRGAAAWLVERGMDAGELSAALQAEGLPGLVRAAPGRMPRRPQAEEALARCLSAMAAEGLRLIARGVVARPSDIDLAMILGAGFARWQGGPMHWAERRGLLILRRDLRAWSADSADLWQPPPLLDDLVSAGNGFQTFARPSAA